jgi:dolichyl-phosphate beta-glucosyltransferase
VSSDIGIKMQAPRFVYLIPCHNEASILTTQVKRLSEFVVRFPGSRAFLLDNGSVDATWEVARHLSAQHPEWLVSCRDEAKGMGVAYRRGLSETARHAFRPPLTNLDWVVLTAADLPFGFSDIESLLSVDAQERATTTMFVGSKAHPSSRIARDVKRRVGTFIFSLMRFLVLGLRTKDTQGTLILRGDLVSRFQSLRADDYFVSIEVVDRAEQLGKVRELPIVLEAELRPSRVKLLRDGWRMLRQMIRHRKNRPSVARPLP